MLYEPTIFLRTLNATLNEWHECVSSSDSSSSPMIQPLKARLSQPWNVKLTMKTIGLNLPGLRNTCLFSDSKAKEMCLICSECVAVFRDYSVHQWGTTFRKQLYRGITGRGCVWLHPTTRAVLFLCTLKCVWVRCDQTLKRETMSKRIFFFITYIYVGLLYY